MTVLDQLEQDSLSGTCTVFQFCEAVAKMFKVRSHEVAVLSLRHSMLQFIYPPELRTAGMIPLISSAQAAKTATSRKSEIFNRFVAVRHSSIFETIKIGGDDPLTIQKLMSAPVFNPRGETLGVIQICHKGATPESAGADFTAADLKLVDDTAKTLGRIWPRLQERRIDSVPNSKGPFSEP